MSSNSVRPVLFILLALALSVNALAQNDSIRDLQEVTVVADAEHKSNTTSSPTQIKTKIDIEKLPALQVSDVLKHLSGVNIKDYGGIGGLKTVSVRSLGAAHTAVSYDGITVADGQNGQIDISRFSLDNLSSLELVNGQSDGIFPPPVLWLLQPCWCSTLSGLLSQTIALSLALSLSAGAVLRL